MKQIILLCMVLVLFGACDSKDIGKQIAKSQYDDLEKKYKGLCLKYDVKNRENQKIKLENKNLKEKMKTYKHGFKSMYE